MIFQVQNVVLDTHQKEMVSFAVRRCTAVLNSVTGSGKTLCALLTIAYLLKHTNTQKALFVVTVASRTEIQKEVQAKTTFGRKFFEIKSLEDVQSFFSGSESVAVIERQKILKICEDHTSLMLFFQCLRQSVVAVLYDEVHKFANPTAQITKLWTFLNTQIPYRYGFTATAIHSKILDLFGIVEFISPGYFGSQEQFLESYAVRKVKTGKSKSGREYSYKRIIRFKHLEQLRTQIKPLVYTYWNEIIPNYCVRTVPFSGDRTQYDLLAEDALKSHSSRFVELQYAVDNLKSKQQLFLSSVRELLPKGVLVFAAYYPTLDMLRELLREQGVLFKSITGKQSKKSREAARDWFVDDPTGKVLFLSRAGGESYNLHVTNEMVIYNVHTPVGGALQLIGRIVRQYSKFTEFNIYPLLVEDSIDSYKWEYVTQNSELVRAVLGNHALPGGASKSFNSFVLERLRRRYVWRKEW